MVTNKWLLALLCIGCGDSFEVSGIGELDSGSVPSGGRAFVSDSMTPVSDAHDGAIEPPAAGGSSGSGGSSSGGSDGSSGSSDGTGGTASGGTGGSGECTTGAVQCVDAQRQTCVGGLWLDNGAACAGWCLEGVCVDCKPGDRSCANRDQPQTCSARGSWAANGAVCTWPQQMCSAGACVSLGCGSDSGCGPACAPTEACVGCTSPNSPALSSCRYIQTVWNVVGYCCPWS